MFVDSVRTAIVESSGLASLVKYIGESSRPLNRGKCSGLPSMPILPGRRYLRAFALHSDLEGKLNASICRFGNGSRCANEWFFKRLEKQPGKRDAGGGCQEHQAEHPWGISQATRHKPAIEDLKDGVMNQIEAVREVADRNQWWPRENP